MSSAPPAAPEAPASATPSPTLDPAELAHELRNVLSAIAGRVELLRADASPEALRRGLDAIERAADDAAALVRRLEADASPASAPLDLRALLDDVAARAEVRAARPLHVHVSGEPAPTLGDATALRQVLTNLAYNAVDALPAGGRLELRAGRGPQGVFAEVRDDGPGIDAATQARIFERRYTTKGAHGRGLGLGIADALARRAGGRLELESTPGSGTCFRLLLPAVEPRDGSTCAAAPALPPPKTRAAAGFGRMLPHVLVVDDEPSVREVLADMLRTQDYTVDEVDGGRAAIERFVQFRYDLVFTDLGMPDMNGWEVAAALKAARPEVPVVIVTGWDTQGSARAMGAPDDAVAPAIDARADAARSSADAVIAKPFRLGELVPLAARLVGASSR